MQAQKVVQRNTDNNFTRADSRTGAPPPLSPFLSFPQVKEARFSLYKHTVLYRARVLKFLQVALQSRVWPGVPRVFQARFLDFRVTPEPKFPHVEPEKSELEWSHKKNVVKPPFRSAVPFRESLSQPLKGSVLSRYVLTGRVNASPQ